VVIVDNTNGARLQTFASRGDAGTGVIGINGAAAHLVHPGDEVILMTFHQAERATDPICVLVDGENRFVRYLLETPGTVPSF
jgi:aspartate 1-decarboxylase